MADIYLIKKYANRKLYDTVERRYVRLDEVADLHAAGHSIRIVDQPTGQDITAAVATWDAASDADVDVDLRGHQVARPGTRRTANPSSGPATVKGRSEQIVDLLRSSLALPAALGQRAASEIGQLPALDSVLALRLPNRRSRHAAANGAEVAELRAQIESLTTEIEELRGEVADMRPLSQTAVR